MDKESWTDKNRFLSMMVVYSYYTDFMEVGFNESESTQWILHWLDGIGYKDFMEAQQ